MSLGRKIEVISEDHIQSRESCVTWESLMKVMEELKGKALHGEKLEDPDNIIFKLKRGGRKVYHSTEHLAHMVLTKV